MLSEKEINEAFKKAEKGDEEAIKVVAESTNDIIFSDNGQLNPGFASKYYKFMAQVKASRDVVDYFQECIKLDIQAKYEKAFQEHQSGLTKTKLIVLHKHSAECHKMVQNIAATAAKGFNELSMQISEDDAHNMVSHQMQFDKLNEQKEEGILNENQYNVRTKSLDKRYEDIFTFIDTTFTDFMRNQKTQLDNTLSTITKFVDKKEKEMEPNNTVIDGEYRKID